MSTLKLGTYNYPQIPEKGKGHWGKLECCVCMCVCVYVYVRETKDLCQESTVLLWVKKYKKVFLKNEKECHRRASTKYLPHWYSKKYKHYTEIVLYIIKLEKNV